MRIEKEPAFILHSRFYKETSLLLDVFTRNFGRFSMLAKGARRAHSQWRGMLLAFQPLELACSGKGELKNLNKLEWLGGLPQLSGNALCCAFYANELLRVLLPPFDSNAPLFSDYYALLVRLSQNETENALRLFELSLLKQLGYSPFWGRDSSDLPIDIHQNYLYHIESGKLLPENQAQFTGIFLSGKTLINLNLSHFDDFQTKNEAKQLMRAIFAFHLNGKTLVSREIFRALLEHR